MEVDMVSVFNVSITIDALGVDTKASLLKGMISWQSLVIHKTDEGLNFVWGLDSPNPFESLIWFQGLSFIGYFYVSVGRVNGEHGSVAPDDGLNFFRNGEGQIFKVPIPILVDFYDFEVGLCFQEWAMDEDPTPEFGRVLVTPRNRGHNWHSIP
ncbi:hypothetical protein KY284_032356 [Solanum tuberosum]|nr:hypothetical protein KY284_032356 [Solanum tuberosum]